MLKLVAWIARLGNRIELRTSSLRVVALAGFMAVLAATDAAGMCQIAEQVLHPQPQWRIVSGRVEAVVHEATDRPGRITMEIKLDGQTLVSCSPHVELADGTGLGEKAQVESATAREFNERFEQFPGKRREVIVEGSELVLSAADHAGSDKQDDVARGAWEFVVRVSDDGVAWRYRILSAPLREVEIAREDSTFELAGRTRSFPLPLNSFTSSYEAFYHALALEDVPGDWLIAAPLLMQHPGGAWLAITEADLDHCGGMYLVSVAEAAASREGDAVLATRLSPRADGSGLVARAAVPYSSPWRVVLIGDDPGRFLESDFILSLNQPCQIADTSWIHPGKTTFPWWNGWVDPAATTQGIDVGLNTETTKYYIDFCAKAGIPYHTLDGTDTAWYGGPISYKDADPTTAVEGLDLPDVIAYARERGVRLRVWMHWKAARNHMRRAFPLYHQWGIEGVMLDFMDRDDQEMIEWLQEAIRLAAENQLTVTLHGASKPTGLERTFPNLLNSEGARNLEYNKWAEVACTPQQQLTIFFARMLAGPLDFHQGGVRTVSSADFEPRFQAPLVIGRPCRTLASYIVIENHLPMVADYPSAYTDAALLNLLVAVPDTWDDTRVLQGEVGKFMVVARRSGQDWWIAAMTDDARVVRLPLSFAGPGVFEAVICQDGDEGGGVAIRPQSVSDSDDLVLSLSQAGAGVVVLKPRGDELSPEAPGAAHHQW